MKEKKAARQLTKAETQVMNILWALPEQQGFIQDIIERHENITVIKAGIRRSRHFVKGIR